MVLAPCVCAADAPAIRVEHGKSVIRAAAGGLRSATEVQGGLVERDHSGDEAAGGLEDVYSVSSVSAVGMPNEDSDRRLPVAPGRWQAPLFRVAQHLSQKEGDDRLPPEPGDRYSTAPPGCSPHPMLWSSRQFSASTSLLAFRCGRQSRVPLVGGSLAS